MKIQISTNLLLKPIKIINNMILCEYAEHNSLYPKGKQSLFYECDLRDANIFDFIGE